LADPPELPDESGAPDGGLSLHDRARAALSGISDDARLKRYADNEALRRYAEKAKHTAGRAAAASAHLTSKVSQEESWTEMRAAVDDLTAIIRSHHALILDLREEVSDLKRRLKS
jgi:hypothetical protein